MDDLRALLQTLAAEVDDVLPPPDLVRRGRRRTLFQVLAGAGAPVLVVVAVALLVPKITSTTPPATAASTPPAATAASPPPAATAASLLRGRWTIGPRSPLGRRPGATLTWTGSEVLAIGLERADFAYDNAAYDPAAATWRRLARAPLDLGMGDGPQLWLGERLFAFHGTVPGGYNGVYQDRPHALLYDPRTDTWTRTSADPLGAISSAVAVLVDGQVLVAGVIRGAIRSAMYDPASDTWSSADPPLATDHPAAFLSMVSTAAGTLLWSHWSRSGANGAGFAGVDVLRLTDSWSDVTGGWQQQTVTHPQVVDGRVLLEGEDIWCGWCHAPHTAGKPGRLVDPRTLAVSRLPAGPLDVGRPPRIWTGAAEIDVNLRFSGGSPAVERGYTAVRDPATGAWTVVARSPVALDDSTRPVWAGTRLLALSLDGRAVTFG